MLTVPGTYISVQEAILEYRMSVSGTNTLNVRKKIKVHLYCYSREKSGHWE